MTNPPYRLDLNPAITQIVEHIKHACTPPEDGSPLPPFALAFATFALEYRANNLPPVPLSTESAKHWKLMANIGLVAYNEEGGTGYWTELATTEIFPRLGIRRKPKPKGSGGGDKPTLALVKPEDEAPPPEPAVGQVIKLSSTNGTGSSPNQPPQPAE
ncbi:MAG: hypothetical protein EBR79_00515 [Proteobacteria bacterium]|nr:hypothetical protein [Pseudomonadota bacterium]NBX86196.1 hypothetical protein [Pseudomonadota bacterium]